jgi:hypothetical protein
VDSRATTVIPPLFCGRGYLQKRDEIAYAEHRKKRDEIAYAGNRKPSKFGGFFLPKRPNGSDN